MITIDFTYDVVTPESAEIGDVAECGFITPGMWHYPAPEDYDRKQWAIGDLAYLVDFAQSLGVRFDGGRFHSVDPDINFRTGESTTYGMHIDGVTPATFQRIARLLD